MPPIYHITSVDNLPGIIKEGGLFCDRDAKNIQFVSIGHKRIKERRLRKRVPLGPGGVLADYVPFYFAPRSPMLFTINKGNVEGYTGGQEPIVHLVSSTEAVDAEELEWVFTEAIPPAALPFKTSSSIMLGSQAVASRDHDRKPYHYRSFVEFDTAPALL